MARRRARRRHAIDAGLNVESFLRLAGTIVLQSLAFVVWNIGTRSPIEMLRDMRAAFGDRHKIFIGCVRALIGLIFIAAAIELLFPALVDPIVDFLPAELFTLLVALAIEHLVGNDLRELIGPREHLR